MLFLSLFDQDKAIELVSTFTFCFIFNMFKVFKQHAYDTNTLFEEDTSKMYLLANIKKKNLTTFGFHVYKNIENWRPVKGQKLIFHREFDNDFDRFTVAGKTLLPGKLAPSVVGHVPRELSRYIWNAFRYVAIITAEVKDERPMRSPLVQDELEILIEMSNVMLSK